MDPGAGRVRTPHIRGAPAAGSRYVRNAPRVRRLILFAALFIPGAVALWALLPVVAKTELGLGAPGYGALLGAVGVGAVAGSLLLRPLTRRLGGDGRSQRRSSATPRSSPP
ncbi:MFS transporter [Streptomyces sp. NPDC005820]|uniref:MFS transporter n=1 Tax=Streptomyces sp. NPDC005820 TaxID=3157069 RepID=UPI0033F9FC68